MTTEALPLAGTARPRHRGFTDAVWDFFCSLKLTLALLALCMVAFAIGTFVLQNKPLEELQRVYPAWLIQVFHALGFFDVYHATWFTLLIILLSLNLTACSLERLPPIWTFIHSVDHRLTDVRLSRLRHTASFAVADAPRHKDAIAAALREHFGPVDHVNADADATHFFAERHRYQRTGVYIVHLSLLLMFSGGIIGSLLGWDGVMNIPENKSAGSFYVLGKQGRSLKIPLDFEIRCNDFTLEKFTSGAAKDYKSDLSVLVDGREVMRKVIEVGDPLQFRGWTLYQSSFQELGNDPRFTVHAAIPATAGGVSVHQLARGERFRPAASASDFVVENYAPSYGELGPALQVTEYPATGAPSTFLLFQKHPGFDAVARPRGPALTFAAVENRALFATGIQIAKDPGNTLVFLGFALIIVGLYMNLVMHHRRVWVRIDPGHVRIAGYQWRDSPTFDTQFQTLCRAVARAVGPPFLLGDAPEASS